MTEFPPLTHVALTVRDLEVSAPWYEALLDARPVIDEDTDPDMHHTVYLLGNGTLLGLHQHQRPAPPGRFSEFQVGLDHVAFGCANRDQLEKWSRRLDELGIEHEAEEYRGLPWDKYWIEGGRVYTEVLPFFARRLEW